MKSITNLFLIIKHKSLPSPEAKITYNFSAIYKHQAKMKSEIKEVNTEESVWKKENN
jgi:hypothetical protein